MRHVTRAWLWNRFEITRPHNLAVAALTVLAGWVAAGGGDWKLLLPACLASILVAAAGNVINDCFDVRIDRINKPRRPLPSGRMTLPECRRYYAFLTALALVVAAAAGTFMLRIAVGWTLLLFLYSAFLKTRFLWGNLTVSFVCASGFPVGATLAGAPQAGILPAILSFFFLMGREIVKDVEDLRGDRAVGASTLAQHLGPRRALGVALLCFLLFAVLVPWPYWAEVCNRRYLLIMLACALPLLAWASWLMMHDSSPRNLVRVSWILKIDMFVGVLGFWLGLTR
jgi:geranylgeranylglycerol-phosphate geranylgeranyltransferase